MTTANLDALFAPRAIVLVGASARAGSVGAVLASNLVEGGFPGELMFVNPRGGSILGRTVFAAVSDLPLTPDLAVVATPAPAIPGVIAELGARGCRAAVIISAGFEEGDPETARLRGALLEAARAHGVRLIGPNCLGVLSPREGINASFAKGKAATGGLALIAQSGAVAAAALDWAPAHGLGFSHVVTVGDSLDVDMADLLEHLAADPATDAILLYVESLREAPRFLRAARMAALAKPVIAIKGGRSAAGAKAAFSHTGALAGADAVYEAAFRRAGVLQVETLDAFLDAAATFSRTGAEPAQTLAILTNGGGAGVLAVDALERHGGQLARLSDETLATLARVAPDHWSRGNPVDILGDAQPAVFGRALDVLMAAPEVDAVLILNCPTAVADSTEAADAVIAAVRASPHAKPIFTSWIGETSQAEARRRFAAAGLPTFPSPESAVRGFAQLTRVEALQAQLRASPDSGDSVADVAAARAVVAGALADGRAALTPPEVSALLAAYGIPALPARIVRSPDDAGAAAEAFGGAVALKILSADISHKSDVGGVQLHLSGRDATTAAATAMLAAVAKLRPDAVVEGFLVQPMVIRPKAQEILAGLVRDPTFGPVVMVGHGGVAVEVLADRVLGLAPLDLGLARDMIARTRVSRLLAGYRDRPPADLDALSQVLVALGRLAIDLPEVAELDLNPVLCDETGALTVDARVALRPAP